VSRFRLIFAMFCLLACLPALAASTWWDVKWHYRAKVDVNTTTTGAAVDQAPGRTRVLVRLHAGNFNFASAKEDGSDVRFVASDDKTPLKYHFEKYDGLVDQVGLAWVDLPALEANSTAPIYVYFGNPDAGAGVDAKGSYDADTVAVFHFTNQATIGQDSTAYGNNASAPLALADSAIIGAGLRLDGHAPVVVPASASLNFPAAQALTVSAWIKPASANASGVVLSLPGAMTLLLENGVVVAEAAGGARTASPPAQEAVKPSATPATSSANGATQAPPVLLAKDAWTHVAVRVDGKTMTVFVNGKSAGEVAVVLPAASAGLLLGGEPEAKRANFIGQLDEVEVAKAALSPGAIEVAARSQGLDAKLLSFEPVEERAGEGGHGYFGILLNALTPDAWAVIIILMVMGLISWTVMLGKGVYINATANANERFLSAFRKYAHEHPLHDAIWEREAGDACSLSGERSNLARLLAIGLDELRGRLAANPGRTSMRRASIAAIRSALDAAAVREGQRLNKWMVLLTIAISGGPFLGLLGTVVGVMITFAAVAAAGDVNINAIAPGIAAALMATVAGLAVAIPALFGYNYLVSRSESIAADMQVFVDELEKRIAEDYTGKASPKTKNTLRAVGGA
jgi:biopolymer transport protein ExbB